MAKLRIGGNLFTDIAIAIGGMTAGKQREEHARFEENRETESDARAAQMLELQQREAESNNRFRDTQSRLANDKAMGEQQSLPALRARLMDLYKRTGAHVDPKLLEGMNYDAINNELNRAEREMEVRAARQLQQGQHLQLLREAQAASNAQFNVAYRQWQQELNALGGNATMATAVDAMAGTKDRTSASWQQAAAAFLKRQGSPSYQNYMKAAMISQEANARLGAAGGGATTPSMEIRSVSQRMPFELLSPQDQQARMAQVQSDIAAGKPIDAGSLAAVGVPIPGATPPATVQQQAGQSAVPFKGFGDPATQRMFSQPGAQPDPRALAAQLSGDESMLNATPFTGVSGSSGTSAPPMAAPAGPAAPNIPSMQLSPLFSGSQPGDVGQPVPPMMRMMGAMGGGMPGGAAVPTPSPVNTPMPAASPSSSLFNDFHPVMFTPPFSAPNMRVQTPTPSLFDRAAGPGAGAAMSGPPKLYPGSSMPPAPVNADLFDHPVSLPGMNVTADAPPRNGPMGPTLPSMQITAPMSAAAPSLSGTINSGAMVGKLRAAMSAPEAEQIARQLLDQGMNYDMVTGSIPAQFQGLVSAKLPKRIPPGSMSNR